MIKRYGMTVDYHQGKQVIIGVLLKDGEWMECKDHEAAIKSVMDISADDIKFLREQVIGRDLEGLTIEQKDAKFAEVLKELMTVRLG